MPRILVVDDEQDLCEILRFNLESENFEVDTANSAEEALELIATAEHLIPEPNPYSMILLDVMMEEMSGFDMAQQLREEGNNTPIIFLTALTTESKQLKGFESGGDDYITKPFSFQTVLARVRAVLKRTSPQHEEKDSLEGRIIADISYANLTKKEHRILQLLISHPGRFYSREQILKAVWDEDAFVGDRSVDVHIARLRKKMGDDGHKIGNKTGFGYYYDTNRD